MNYVREIARNNTKRKQGNNKIKLSWRRNQIKKYGIKNWCEMFNQSKKYKTKASKITPKTAYYV